MNIPPIWRNGAQRKRFTGLQRGKEGGGVEVSFSGTSWHLLSKNGNHEEMLSFEKLKGWEKEMDVIS